MALALTNSSAQTLAVGDRVIFNPQPLLNTDGDCCCRSVPFVARITEPGTYSVTFEANISGATAGAPLQLSLQLDGQTIPYSTMVYTPAAADAVGHVSITIPINICCRDNGVITVVNNGVNPIDMQANPLLYIKR